MVVGEVDLVTWYNTTWLLYAAVVVCGLSANILFNLRATKATKQNAIAWISTELGIIIRIGWWQLGSMFATASDGKFAGWAVKYDWVLIFPFMAVVAIGCHFLLRRLDNQLWYILGMSTIPIGWAISMLHKG